MSNGSRSNTNNTLATDLVFNFTSNGSDFAPFSVNKVEIYNSYSDAQNNLNIVETILPASITIDDSNSQVGVNSTIKYTSSINASAGQKYDKIYIVPIDGMNAIEIINQYYNQENDDNLPLPSDKELVRVTLNIFDILNNAQKNSKVVWRLNVKSAWYGNDLIKQEKETFIADDNGNVTMDLVETDTILKDTFDLVDNNNPTNEEQKQLFYRVEIADGRATYNVRVPKGTGSIAFKNLPNI